MFRIVKVKSNTNKKIELFVLYTEFMKLFNLQYVLFFINKHLFRHLKPDIA